MPFFEDHYEYILECASVRAAEISRITGIDDTEDWVQDILIHVWKNGKLATVVVYTKMSRGEMTRYILKNRIESVEQLKTFAWEGFEFNEQLSDETKYVFTNGKTE